LRREPGAPLDRRMDTPPQPRSCGGSRARFPGDLQTPGEVDVEAASSRSSIVTGVPATPKGNPEFAARMCPRSRPTIEEHEAVEDLVAVGPVGALLVEDALWPRFIPSIRRLVW
jgi:hypothetical protein